MSSEDFALLELSGLVAERSTKSGDRFRVKVDEFHIYQGEVITVTGKSGSGKSTLLEVLSLILKPKNVEKFQFQTKESSFDLADEWKLNRREKLATFRAHFLGIVLQTGGLLPFVSVQENIVLSNQLLGLSQKTALFDQITEHLDIKHLVSKFPSELSIGQRQRVSIARAIMHQPHLVLADEPTSALDPDLSAVTWQLLLTLAKEMDVAFVIVSHDWRLASRLGLRQYMAHQEYRDGVSGSEFIENVSS